MKTYPCDTCGAKADAIHLIPWASDTLERVELSCPEHDPGGYWFTIKGWRGKDPYFSLPQHLIDTKTAGEWLVSMVEQKLADPRSGRAASVPPEDELAQLLRCKEGWRGENCGLPATHIARAGYPACEQCAPHHGGGRKLSLADLALIRCGVRLARGSWR